MKNTTWSQATSDKLAAVENLISCHRAGHRPIITKRNNLDLGAFEYPLNIPNPALNDWRNYTMSYGVPNSMNVYAQIAAIKNATEKDLAANYTSYFFENQKEKDDYLNKGKLPRKFTNRGVCGPMKKSDFLKLRPNLVKAGWGEGSLWTTFWKPLNGIPYYVAEDCGEVYCVTIAAEPAMSEKEFEKFLSEFLAK
jgi:hypothetical protein